MIIILDESLINKIAAGEVIERPASVVKELIENSIDAGAKKIFVEVKEGGKSYIKVSDDGFGMNKKDAELSWRRHSTSKIKDVEDLFSINTLGFRGEALASMAAVSELTITSKANDISGVKITIKAGKELSKEEIGCPKGTAIEVKNLFFNTPARKKYLKSMEVELRHITNIITRYSLIHPEIHFKLKHHNKEILNAPSTDFLTNITSIYGSKIGKELLKVDYENEIKIAGYISKPSISKSTKNEQSIYVNKRYIKNSLISKALNDAYSTLVMTKRYPLTILNISIKPEKTDVNVHPQKAEIRIRDEHQLYQAVFEAIRTTLIEQDLIPQTIEPLAKKLTDFKTQYKLEPKQELLVKETAETTTKKLPDMKILGIINKTYILTEIPGNLLLIDQHAAVERIMYEKYKKQLKNKEVKVQDLLDPIVIELTPKQYSTAIENIDFFKGLGYNFEEFGTKTILLGTIPIVLGKQFDKDLFIDFIDELDKNKKPVSLEMFFHNKIARMACRKAIKAGDEITLPQIKKYIQELSDTSVSYTCPHGRPIMIKWSFYELEKMFKRVV